MKKSYVIGIVIVLLLAITALFFRHYNQRSANSVVPINTQNNIQKSMIISSSAFAEGQTIPKKYTCDGDGVNPPLEFKDVPAEAKSLALIIDDPDAPVGTWTHWILWNISPLTTSIAENSVPTEALQGKTSSGQNNYGGPCPPSGQHRYFFKIYALDTMLKIPTRSTADELIQAMSGHIISQAELMGKYGR